MTNKLQDLIAQRAALDAQIATEKTAQLAVAADAAAQAFADAADAAAQAFADAGVSLDEGAAILLSRHKASEHRRKSAAKAPPKYRHTATGATWSGKGRKPHWFNAPESAGAVEHLG